MNIQLLSVFFIVGDVPFALTYAYGFRRGCLLVMEIRFEKKNFNILQFVIQYQHRQKLRV